jgi:hypothetical protein
VMAGGQKKTGRWNLGVEEAHSWRQKKIIKAFMTE